MIFRVFLISILFLAAIACLYIRFEKLSRLDPAALANKQPRFIYYEAAIVFIALFVHLRVSIHTSLGDPNYFASITNRMLNGDFSGLYSSGGITYPPLFNYLIFIWGHILQLLHIPISSQVPAFIFCIKLPGILCEFLMAALIYRAASVRKNSTDVKTPEEIRQFGMRITAIALILVNPGCIFVSSYITQVDAIYTFFTLLTVYLLHKKHLKTAFFVFAAAIMLKFQAVFIAPVVFYALIDQVVLHNFSWKQFWSHLAAGLAAIACMGLSYIPFIIDFHSKSVAKGGLLINFTSSVKSYGWATQNAYNFWALMGYNFRQGSEPFGPMSCENWGTLFIILVVILSAILFIRTRKNACMYPLIGAILVSGIFLFSVKMMPRYLFPAIVLIILGFAIKPGRRRLLCALTFSIYFFLVTTFDYIVYPLSEFSYDLPLPYLISAYGIFCFGLLVHTIWKEKQTA